MSPDFPVTRLLPGKGMRMQGYGATKALAGIRAIGTNGVLTLSRSEKSGLMPRLGTDEQPVALRAGPGVRIHGYDGIYTLERLSVPTEEEPPAPLASLELEIEIFEGYSRICFLAEVSQPAGEFVISQDITQNRSNGSYVDTLSKSGEITGWGPEDETPDDCAATEESSTYDDTFDYGSFVSSETTQETVPHTSLLSPARDALDTLSDTIYPFGPWLKNTWQDISEEVTPFTYGMGRTESTDPQFGTQTVRRIRYRMRNTGNIPLRVNHGFYGSGASGGADDEIFDSALSPGLTVGWFDSGIPDADPDKYRTAEIRRVRIGRWRTIA